MKKRYHYVELVVTGPQRNTITRIPGDGWEESKRSAALLAADLFYEDPYAIIACTRGNYCYENSNDLGDKVVIRPIIATKKLAIGNAMTY